MYVDKNSADFLLIRQRLPTPATLPSNFTDVRPPAKSETTLAPSQSTRMALGPGQAPGNMTARQAAPRASSPNRRVSWTPNRRSPATCLSGERPPRAHTEAILLQHGVRTLYTNDRDFRKFESLDVRDPFA